jgi:hypothetical protein
MEVRMRVDLYTKAVLTAIAVALMGIFASSIYSPAPVSAQSPDDMSRLEVSVSGNQLVVFNNMTGEINVLDLNSGRHLRSWRIENAGSNLTAGN